MKESKFFLIFSFDATKSDRLGKFVNDSSTVNANAKIMPVDVEGSPHLCFFAGLCWIMAGTELR